MRAGIHQRKNRNLYFKSSFNIHNITHITLHVTWHGKTALVSLQLLPVCLHTRKHRQTLLFFITFRSTVVQDLEEEVRSDLVRLLARNEEQIGPLHARRLSLQTVPAQVVRQMGILRFLCVHSCHFDKSTILKGNYFLVNIFTNQLPANERKNILSSLFGYMFPYDTLIQTVHIYTLTFLN